MTKMEQIITGGAKTPLPGGARITDPRINIPDLFTNWANSKNGFDLEVDTILVGKLGSDVLLKDPKSGAFLSVSAWEKKHGENGILKLGIREFFMARFGAGSHGQLDSDGVYHIVDVGFPDKSVDKHSMVE